jgi:ADP-ribosyl-[dinitrogen reductase] hydrolase
MSMHSAAVAAEQAFLAPAPRPHQLGPGARALSQEISYTLLNRSLGSYLGLAVGDALGAPVEFMTAREIRAQHRTHRHMTGGGWLRLRPGQVTDDTGMCLALGDALLGMDEWSIAGVADGFVGWMRTRPVDIGNTCRRGITRYLNDGTLVSRNSREDAGNGALMRNLPVVLATLDDCGRFERWSLDQARFTHNNELSDAAILCLGRMTRGLLEGGSVEQAWMHADLLTRQHRDFRFDPWPGNTSGYVVDTVQTVLDAFFNTCSFEDCLLRAVNRGGDADTIGALAGQLAGACYGVHAIPACWLRKLEHGVADRIRFQTAALLRLSLTDA